MTSSTLMPPFVINREKEEKKLAGSQLLDDITSHLTGIGKSVIEASKEDDTTWTDDAIRLGLGGAKNVGNVLNAPGIRQALQALGAPAWIVGQGLGWTLEKAGVDPRYGHIAGEVGEWFIPFYGAAKLVKKAKQAVGGLNAISDVSKATNVAADVAAATKASEKTAKIRGLTTQQALEQDGLLMAIKRNIDGFDDALDSPGDWADARRKIDLPSKNPGPEAGWTNVATELKNDVDFQNIWGKDVDSAADKLDEAVNYARRNSDQGYTLKGYNNEFYDQNGVKFKVVRIKNTPVNLKEGFGYQLVPEINYQQARMIRRHREAVPLQEVISYVRELRPEWSDARILDVAKKYKKYVTDGNKALTRVSQAWNKSLGGPFMSIDHIKDLKSGGRNIPTNRRLFPKIPNSAKNATQLYADDVLTAIGARWNLKEDIAAFIDPDIAGFWRFIDDPKKTEDLINMVAKGWDVNDAISMIEQNVPTSMNPAQYKTYISKTAGKASIPLPEYPYKPPKPQF